MTDPDGGPRTLHLREEQHPELFAALRRAAAENERTLSGQARLAMKRGLEADGYAVDRRAA